MKVFGQLEKAQIENLAADPTGVGLVPGLIWFNTTDSVYRGYTGSTVIEFADLTTAQTFQNKTLQGNVVSDYLEFDQSATPANPATGKNRIYFKSDGTAYTLDENGNEQPLGSGSGGSKSYFDPVDAEIDSTVGNWATDNGSGSAAAGLTLSLTNVVGELLAGDNSLKITKDAANRNGEFVKVALLPIDPSDRGRVNYGSFEFRALSGYVSGDLIVEVYDVTNAEVLYSGPTGSTDLLATKGRASFVAHLADDTAALEFRLKVNSANATAWDIVVDEFKFGPSTTALTPTIERIDETIANPTVIYNSNQVANVTNFRFQGYRIGNKYTLGVEWASSIGFNNSANFANISVDLSQFQFFAGKSSLRGTGTFGTNVNDSANGRSYCFGYMEIGSGTALAINHTGDLPDSQINGRVNRGTLVMTTSDEDASSVVNETELALQTVKVKAQGSTQSIPPSTITRVIFNTEIDDNTNSYDPTTGLFTTPRDGWYRVAANCWFDFAAWTEAQVAYIAVVDPSNVIIEWLDFRFFPINTGSGEFPVFGDARVFLTKGQQIAVGILQNNPANRVLKNSSIQQSLSIVAEEDFNLYGVVQDTTIGKVATLKDVKASGVSGGTSAVNNTRTFNTVEDPDNLIASTTSTVWNFAEKGVYFIEATAPTYRAIRTQAYIQTDPANTVVLIGSSEYSAVAGDNMTSSIVKGFITVNDVSVGYKLTQYIQSTTATDGLGVNTGNGLNNVYSQIKITKIRGL